MTEDKQKVGKEPVPVGESLDIIPDGLDMKAMKAVDNQIQRMRELREQHFGI